MPNQLMVERAKEIIIRDCIDLICVTPSKICRYLNSKKRDPEFHYICGVQGSDLKIDKAVKIALEELSIGGVITKVGRAYRKKFTEENN